MRYSLLIRGVTIIDGTGKPPFVSDVGVRGRYIVEVGPNLFEDARYILNAKGRVLMPGLTDTHTHDDNALLKQGLVKPKLQQGITSSVIGNCGFSPAPCGPETAQLQELADPVLGKGEPWNYPSMSAWMQALRRLGLGQNISVLVGLSAVRCAVMGFAKRPAREDELRSMETLVHEAMEAGAAGLSLGLIYAPGAWTAKEELIRLARVVGSYGGVLVPHMRNEADGFLDSIKEVLEIARAARVALHISHLKLTGPNNWGRMGEALELIESSRANGMDVTVDVYPFDAAGAIPYSMLPPWAIEGGLNAALERLGTPEQYQAICRDLRQGIPGWENILFSDKPENLQIVHIPNPEIKFLEGKSIAEAASVWGKEIPETLCDLILATKGEFTLVSHCLNPREVDMVISKPYAMIGSDGLPTDEALDLKSPGKPHPRLYQTTTEAIRRGLAMGMPLEEIVRKMTSLPAWRFGMKDRGTIEVGKVADFVLFNIRTLRSVATYLEPKQHPNGIIAVIVGGKPIVRNNVIQFQRAGEVVVPRR
ncbi:N-acyl-D-amino-acid deacylase family protein [Ktedonospora formicarum]|uniref:Dihydroorotase n=1 Tax=Ktedonospora formicarum TaxID=2778364 RepID=A0A8J3I3Q3_9CHLR|nr:D-aminoacylase [Ktedonospora formicarum]GHO49607.1 dihydroorotase [Ktedonospora formicarum]